VWLIVLRIAVVRGRRIGAHTTRGKCQRGGICLRGQKSGALIREQVLGEITTRREVDTC